MEGNEFYTMETLATLAGATGATFVICNGLQRALNFNPRWLALAVALVVTVGVAAFSGAGAQEYFVAVINGFLVYCSAAGATGVVAAATPAGAGAEGGLEGMDYGPARRRFLTTWF